MSNLIIGRIDRNILQPPDKFFSLQEILSDNSPTPEPIIGNGILLQQSLLLISGKKKIGKSMLAMNLALALSNGSTFSIFKIIRKYRVLLISAEGGHYNNRDRIKKMAAKFRDNTADFDMSFDPRLLIDDSDGLYQLNSIISYYEPEVLIIDPLIKFHNRDENSAKEMAIIMTQIRNLIEDYKLSIILVHHMGKDSTSGPRGSSVISGEYDSYIEMTEINKNKHEVKLTFDLRHFETPESINIIFNPATYWFENKIEEPSYSIKLILEYGSMSRKELANKLVEAKMYSSPSNAYKSIKNDLDNKRLLINSDGIICIAK